MSRPTMIILGLLLAFFLVVMYQTEFGSGVNRPWAECRESLVSQMLTGACTPRRGIGGAPEAPREPAGEGEPGSEPQTNQPKLVR